jgi:hypothetical protein
LLPGFKALAFLWVAESGVTEVIEKSSLKTQVNFLTIPQRGLSALGFATTTTVALPVAGIVAVAGLVGYGLCKGITASAKVIIAAKTQA